MPVETEFKLIGDALPSDVSVTRFEMFEAISVPYELKVDFATAQHDFVVDDCLRKDATLEIIEERTRRREVSGVCNRAELIEYDGKLIHFRLTLVPPVVALKQREDNRIYQDKTPDSVVDAVLQAAGGIKTEWRTKTPLAPREYIVQYRETEFNFVSRLLEDEGIFYFFEHDAGEVTMVFGDAPAALDKETDPPSVLSLLQGGGGDPLTHFVRNRSLRTSNVSLMDYDFEKPQVHPKSQKDAPAELIQPYFEYPGGFIYGAEGQRRADARLRALRNDVDTIEGASHSNTLQVGAKVSINGAEQDHLNGEFVITELRSQGSRSSGGNAGNHYENHFRGIPFGQPFAAGRTAIKPRIGGIQTATVQGPSGEDQAIHVDKYGRVKVRFHWDRVGQNDGSATCWLRVTQVPQGGSIILPRVSWEVSVAFLDGDPDRPFVLGRVYNAEKAPPYALPAAKASGAIKSMSTPGGGGHNELNFGDSGGGQGFSVHAQKDLNITVGNNKMEKVAVNETHTVKVDMMVTVGADEATSIGGNQKIDIGSIGTHKISGDQSLTVGGNSIDNATSNHVEKIGDTRSYDVGGMMTVISNTVMQTIAGNLNRDVNAAMVTLSIASISDTVGGDVTENIGLVRLDLCKGSFGETVSGNKNIKAAAADIHLVKGNWAQKCESSLTQLVGGLHYQKVAGDYSVKAPMIMLIGAVGSFKGAGSEMKLGGGPVVVKGSKLDFEGALIAHLGASSTKMG